ncbi:AAA family ATPase [Photobacterium kasasachensis]|uniref:AAA family ATPase n=1 Tax=Photobacterium kasasachensis TaxID=2910240 RepID=UPI003D132A6A
MATVSLPLPPNVLYNQPQQLEFDKIATFIGGNGSGKSTILKSIFDEKLKGSLYEGLKVVCFSSGQNESYSERFAHYLNNERKDKRALSLDCFYYDKSLAKLLVFLSTTGNQNGLVRKFLRYNGYVIENEFEEDDSTKISFDIKVDKAYVNLVGQAQKEEEQGNSDVMTNKAYHLTLSNFINTLVDDSYDFSQPLELKTIQLSQSELSSVSFETDEHTSFDSKIMFFTQAADNDYFVVKKSLNLEFLKVNGSSGEESKSLRLEDLSDGEYQLLFLYALVDLFDRENTLFLFDEADSHLHYKNIDRLWEVYNKIKGSLITTSHLLDSIAKAGIDKLRTIERGEVQYANSSFKLLQRLEALSEVEETQYKIVSMYKNIVVMDHAHDWEIFKLLLKKKLSNDEGYSDEIIENSLSDFICLSVSSGFVEGQDKNTFGDNKINWLKNYERFLTTLKTLNKLKAKTERVFLICDADEYPNNLIGTTENPFLVKGHSFKPTEPPKPPKKSTNQRLEGRQKTTKDPKPLSKVALLSWRRREIKHYLLSYTALGTACDEINRHYAEDCHLKVGKNGDIGIDDKFNNYLAKHPSSSVKKIVDPYINVDGKGFCIEEAQKYVNRIIPEEISDDIVNMYKYLVKG